MENKLVPLCKHCCWKWWHFRALFGLSDIGRLQGSRQICLQYNSLTFAWKTLSLKKIINQGSTFGYFLHNKLILAFIRILNNCMNSLISLILNIWKYIMNVFQLFNTLFINIAWVWRVGKVVSLDLEKPNLDSWAEYD